MRILRVTAHAFGHLNEQTLELAEGLTVVSGPNESGKSTWHAALLAALCGRWPSPRARGEAGIEQRRPWAGRDWCVSAEVVLADGRRVEVRQDLQARLGTATDLGLGRDVAHEITGSRGGMPDASRWLGLDRAAFVATACVRQSHVALATEEVNGIRSYVESAATTASPDATAEETAAAALARIDAFRRDVVGSDRSTTRPLPLAHRRLSEATDALGLARQRRGELDRRSATAAGLGAAAATARLRLARSEQAQAQAEAARLSRQAAEAQALSPSGEVVPAGSTGQPSPARSPAGRKPAVVLLAVAAALVIVAAPAFGFGWALAGAALAVAGAVIGAIGFLARGRSARDDAITRRERLRALVDGGSVTDLHERAQRALRRAEAALAEVASAEAASAEAASAEVASAEVASAEVAAVRVPGPLTSTVDALEVDELRRAYQAAQREADLAERAVAEIGAELEQAPFADAEEAVEAARAELGRLTGLDDVLEQTRKFLQRAQEAVHREIAPTLSAALSRDLATVTAGRYAQAIVDPESLRMRVRGAGAELRDIDQLSVGTREQIYLLLRVALAERVVTRAESCPLLLDDVTVHADAERTARILDVLRTVAQRHQVVLFTAQEQVREWARAKLTGDPHHALQELTALAPA
ncbi:MAG TPA: AAA family ATPase [Micromonosporaceae bacterium]